MRAAISSREQQTLAIGVICGYDAWCGGRRVSRQWLTRARNTSPFYETGRSPCSQPHATRPCPEQDEYSYSQRHITTNGRSVSTSWCRARFGTCGQRLFYFFFSSKLLSCLCGAPSLTRGQVWIQFTLSYPIYIRPKLRVVIFHLCRGLVSSDFLANILYKYLTY
jgi:hypothetical protein